MMKRVLSFVLALLAVLSLCAPALAADEPAPAATSGVCGNDIRWNVTDRTVTLTGTGRMYDYSRQEDSPFFDVGQRKAVVKSGITYIGKFGFAGSIFMESITLPDTVTAIGDYAFFSCNELRYVTLGKNLRTIGQSAFLACPSLEEIELPRSVTSVGYNAFGGNYKGLRSVTVRNPHCAIYDSKNTLGIPGRTVISGYAGSTAQAYAKKYGYTFQVLEKKEGIVTENGKQYIYLDGEKQTGLVDWNGKTYYASAKDGHLFYSQWVTAGSKRYYYCSKDGHILKNGPLTVNGKGYFVDKNGLRQTGLQTWKGKSYYYSAQDGHLLKNGWINAAGGKRYYADKNGVITKGL